MMKKKLKSPNIIGENNTMDSFQDGGQQNMNTEQSEYLNPMEGSHMNPDMNNYPPSSREQMMGVDSFNRMNQNVHPNQMTGYSSFNRENYNPGDQHGGMPMTGSGDFANQNSPFHGQFHAGIRSGYPGNMKSGMGQIRPGMVPPGGNMMPSSYQQQQQRNVMSGQSISQQSGPTPTLNQLLQTPNAPQQRMQPSNYGDFPQKGGNEMVGPGGPYGMQHGWGGNQRMMGNYTQGQMTGPAPGYRNQAGTMGDMNQQQRSVISPPYSHQNQYSNQQFSPNSSRYGMMSTSSGGRQNSMAMGSSPGFPNQMGPPYGQQPSNQMGYGTTTPSSQQSLPPTSHHSYMPQPQLPSQQQSSQPSSQQPTGPTPPPAPQGAGGGRSLSPSSQSPSHRQQPSPSPSQSSRSSQPPVNQTSPSPSINQQQPSPSGSNSSWGAPGKKGSEDGENSMDQQNADDSLDASRGTPTPSSGVQHPVVSALRPTPSPVGSSGSRSNTPASLPGTQAGSPMPPRPPSQQLEGQNQHMTQATMATQGYNQQMMPPPMGPNQMNYPPGGAGSGKMPPSGAGAGGAPHQMSHFSQYNSQYPQQGQYPGRQGPGMPNNIGMQNYQQQQQSQQQQNMFNGPSQGGQMPSGAGYMPMNRNMSNSNYNMYNNQNSLMNNQYGNYNNHMGTGPGTGPGPGPVPGPGPGPGSGTPGINGGMNTMNQAGSGMNNIGVQGQTGAQSGSSMKGGAQAAAQAALLAAANSAANRPQPVRPTMTPNMTSPQRMYSPQNHLNQINNMVYGSNMTGGHPNSMNQLTNSHSPVPSSNSYNSGQIPTSSVPGSGVSKPGNAQENNINDGIQSSSSNSSQQNSLTDGVPLMANIPPGSVNSSLASSVENSSLPSSNIPPSSSTPNMQHDSNSSSSNFSSASVPLLETGSAVPPVSSSADNSSVQNASSSAPDSQEGKTNSEMPPLSDQNTSSSTVTSSTTNSENVSSINNMCTENNLPVTSSAAANNTSVIESSSLPTVSNQALPTTTTTATTISTESSFIVTQSITSPVASISETGSSNDSHPEHIPPPIPQANCLPVPSMPGMMDTGDQGAPQQAPAVSSTPATAEKKKKEGNMSHPSTPSSFVVPSPGGASVSSFHEEFENINSPASTQSWAGSSGTTKAAGADIGKLFELGNEPDRRFFLERLFSYLDERGTPLTSMPTISKQPLDLFRLYLIVRDKGGMLEVTKTKKWKEICGMINIGTSASAAFTLKKNYIKFLFAYECQFDRGGIDPQPILAQMEAQLQTKRESKGRRAPSPASSQGSQDAFRPPSAPNNNSQGLDGFPPNMGPGGYMQNADPGMGPMGMGMMPQNNMMNNMMPPNTMGMNTGMPHNQMPNSMQGGGMMPGNNMGMMGNNSFNMMPGGPAGPGHGPGPGNMMGNSMMPQNSMMNNQMANQMGMPPGNRMPPVSRGMTNQPAAGVLNDSVSCQDPFSDEPSGSKFPRNGGSGSQIAPFSGMPPQQQNNLATSGSGSGNFNRQSVGGSAPQNMPNFPGSVSQSNSAVNFGDSPSRVPPQQQAPPTSSSQSVEQFNDSFRRPPDGFNNSSGRPPVDQFNTSSSSSSSLAPSSSSVPPPSSDRQFPFGDQFSKPERFDSPNPPSSHLPTSTSTSQPNSSQPFRPMPQSVPGQPSMPPQPQQPTADQSAGTATDPMMMNRYGGQTQPMTTPHQMAPSDQMGPHGYQNQPGFPSNKPPMGQDAYSGYPNQPGQFPSQRLQMNRDMNVPGPYGTPNKRFYPDGYVNQAEYNPQSSGYGERPSPMQYHHQYRDGMMSSHDGQIPDRGPNAQWSPMSARYPQQHGGPNYMGPGGMSPGGPGMPPQHMQYRPMPHRMSPTRDKSGYMSPPKMHKGMMPNSHFPQKKEMIFPPDSVEAVSATLSKRRRLTKSDVGQIEAWRIMMALKSGMLAESTWALDTLNILLYDDSTISYFSLAHLPGLLEVLLEHFRRCLITLFGETFEDLEKGINQLPDSNEELILKSKSKLMKEEKDESSTSPIKQSESDSDKENIDTNNQQPLLETKSSKNEPLMINDQNEVKEESVETETPTTAEAGGEGEDQENSDGASSKQQVFVNYTHITRQGKPVKIQEVNDLGPLDPKEWDIYQGYTYKFGHWQLGGGDTSGHVLVTFGSDKENEFYRSKFVRPLMDLKDNYEESGKEGNDDEQSEEGDQISKAGDECVDEDEDEGVKELDDKTNIDQKLNCVCEKKVVNAVIEHKCNNLLSKVQIKQEPCDIDMKDIHDECRNNEDSAIEFKKDERSSNGCEELDSKESNSELETSVKSKQDNPDEEILSKTELDTDTKTDIKLEDNIVNQSSGLKRKADDSEEESFQRDDPPLRTLTDSQDELGRRCVCISNIFRSLSTVPGNDAEMSKHTGLLFTFGKLLTHQHHHLPRNTTRRKFDRDDSELEDLQDSYYNESEWWWEYLTMLRENTLVIFANIGGQLELAGFPEEICLPILDGLLHWSVCPSSCATDPFPSSPTSVLSPQRLVLEALCKLCIHDKNVDLLLATPPFERIIQLFSNLVKLVANKSEQVTMEFAIVLLSELVQGDSSAARGIAMQHPSISLLLDFLETAEQKAMQVANLHGIGILRDNPEMMGTSLDMLRRAANILYHMSCVPDNRTLFQHHQQRILSLVMSQILDQMVAQILADVLFQCFHYDS